MRCAGPGAARRLTESIELPWVSLDTKEIFPPGVFAWHGSVSDLSEHPPPKRAPLKPIPEGWRRFALLGSFAIAALGVLVTLGAVYLLPWLLPYLR
jgi:hypothetical protein